MSKHIIYRQKERAMIYDTFIYLALLLTKQFYQELSRLVTLMTFPCIQEIHITPCLWFSIHVSFFIFSCPVAFPKPETEVSSSFQPHFPDSNLISVFLFKKQHKKGPQMYKNNQRSNGGALCQLRCEWERGTRVCLPSDAPTAGSVGQSRWEGCLAPSAGAEDRWTVSLLWLGNTASFIHACMG